VGHPEFGSVVNCHCQQQRIDEERHARLLRYSNLGPVARYTFDSLKPDGLCRDPEGQRLFREAREAAEVFSQSPAGWLVLAGPHGSGKTHLAAAIGNRCIQRGHVVFFVHAPDLLDHLRASFGPTSEVSYSELFEQVRKTPLLVLDGLGSHATTPWAEEKLRQIVNHRYDAELPTVITAVTPLAEIDEYVLARMRTAGLSRVMELRSAAGDAGHGLGGIEPQMLERMTFDSFDVRGNNPNAAQRASLEAAHRAARNFADDPDGWLTLSGETGVGKTHLAVAIASEFARKGHTYFFAFVPELLDHLRYTFNPESRLTYDRVFDEVKNAPLLVMDDLGRERSSEWAVEKLYQIIVHRHNARLPTVITSSLDFQDELDPITSRVQDPAVSQVVPVDTPDYRNKKRGPQVRRRPAPRRKATG
jgi:DNA replication protein DnaC